MSKTNKTNKTNKTKAKTANKSKLSGELKKYVDLTALSQTELNQLKKILGKKIYRQVHRSKFEKVDSLMREAVHVVDKKGNIFCLPLDKLPKYLSKNTILNVIKG